VTLIELLIAILIMSMLAYALVQFLSTGMTLWQMGEMRRGAYERAQFVFHQVGSDLASLYPQNPSMTDVWSFQVDTLFEADYDGTGHDAVAFACDNISVVEGDGGVRYLRATNPDGAATVEYRFTLPGTAQTLVVQPKISLVRSAEAAPSCELFVEVKIGDGAYDAPVMKFTSGLRDQTVTPTIDISRQVLAGEELWVRFRTVPLSGGTCDVRLFEAARDAPVRPVFRLATSPHPCRTNIDLVSGYGYKGSETQFLRFVRSARGLQRVIYYTDGETLFREQADATEQNGADAWLPVGEPVAVAKGVVYFGCQFQNRYRPGATEAEQQAAMQDYWLEADSVPPYVRLLLSLVPLSGPTRHAYLAANLSASAVTVRVDSTRRFVAASNEEPAYVKIGDEWIQYTGYDGTTFTGCVRGARGTRPAAHNQGDLVQAGEEFFVNIPLAAWGYRSR
jgi:type II secretory pathway pseudopilin PulG